MGPTRPRLGIPFDIEHARDLGRGAVQYLRSYGRPTGPTSRR
jgi:hypothetical protein